MEKRLYLESYHMSCENGKYLKHIEDSVIMCDETMTEIKTPTKTAEAKITSTSFYILLAFLLTVKAFIW